MKRPEKQKRLSLFGVLLFSLGCVWIVAQSNANDDAGLTIDTDRYTAVQNIQEIHLNSSDETSSQRIGLVNTGSTLGIGTVEGGRVGALKNTVQGNASVVGGERNVSQGDETTLILGGEGNAISSSTSNSVIMGGNSNKVFNKSDIILASSGVEANNSEAIALASESSRLQRKNSAVYGARNSTVNGESSMAIGNNVTIKQPGVFVFSVRSGSIEANKKHTFVVNAENGLIIGATKNIGSNIKLTVNGAARVGEAKGGDANVPGAVFRVACSNPSGASCLCANVGGMVKSISSNPACNNVCSKRSQNCKWGATCGTRARIDYAVAERDWRANERYCGEGSHPDSTPDFPQRPADSASWTCISDFGGNDSDPCIASKKVQKKENAECGTYHGMSFIGSTIKNWPTGGSFCKKGTPTPTIPIFPMTGKPVTWTCSGTNLSPVQCQANGCNRCSKDGFPYCFPVDLDPSCKGVPPIENPICEDNKYGCKKGTPTDKKNLSNGLSWKCNLDGAADVSCRLTCPKGFRYDIRSGSCVKSSFICQGELPSHSHSAGGPAPTNNTTPWKLVSSATGGPCEAMCDRSSDPKQNRFPVLTGGVLQCLRCAEGKYDEHLKKCKFAVNNCPDGYALVNVSDKYRCLAIASCLDSANQASNGKSWSMIIYPNLEDNLPYGESVKRNFVAGGKIDNLERHKCQFTCPDGYKVWSDGVGCMKDSAKSNTCSFAGIGKNFSSWSAASRKEDPETDNEDWKFANDASSEKDFYNKYSSKKGCRYWCANPQLKNGIQYCVLPQCDGAPWWGGHEVLQNPSIYKNPWEFVGLSVLQAKEKNNEKGCFWACKDGYTPKSYQGKNTVCWKPCSQETEYEEEYFSMYNGCETCSSKSLVPDPASKDTLGNLTSCTSRCELYSEKMKLKLVWSSKLEKCIISEKSITVCPQNSIDEGPDGQGGRICSVAPSLAKRFFFDEP